METGYIDFRKERDFGQVFNATFTFLKQEFKKLGLALVYYVLPVVLVAGIVTGLMQHKIMGWTLSNANDTTVMSNPFAVFRVFGGYYSVSIVINILAQTMMICTLYGYIALYVEKGKDQFTLPDVGSKIAQLFFPVLGTLILTGIMISIGFVLCIFPGIYLGVSLSLIFAALAIERQGFGEAFTRSFQLTHLQWWWTLLILLVVTIVMLVIVYAFVFLGAILGVGTSLMNMTDEAAVAKNISSIMIVFYTLASIIGFIIYVIPHTVLAFHYFNLVEIKEKPSLTQKIEEIGQE